jgi:hypothetical protein
MILMCSASTESAEYLGSAFIIHDLGRLYTRLVPASALAAIRVIELRRKGFEAISSQCNVSTINAFT